MKSLNSLGMLTLATGTGRYALAAALLLLAASAPLMAGVTVEVLKPGRTYPGTTAFIDNSGHASRIVEIDQDGKTVWEFVLPEGTQPQTRYTSDLEWLSESGHFLFTSSPRGIFEVDRDGNIIWQYTTDKVSHDADRLANGNTLFVFGRDADDDAQVTEVSPDGKIVWQWHAKRHLAGETRQDLPAGRREPYSYTHANAVIRLKNGNTLVSLRNFHLVVEVTPAGDIVWKQGNLPRVHEPQRLPNGNLLMSLLVRPNYHPVREVGPDGATVWEFAQPDLLAPTTVARLPNGNTLIAGQNKIVEVTQDKEVVWRVVLEGVRPSVDDTERHIYKVVRIPSQGK